MTDTAPATPKKRGPNTPEGKARSRMNALKHGLRAREFGLLPEEDQAEWGQHVRDLEEGYGPEDATEKKLVASIAAAMWREIRADRMEAEVLTRHRAPPCRPLARQRPAGARPRRLAQHRDPLPGQRRHGRAPRDPRLLRAPQGQAGRPAAGGGRPRI